MATIRDVELVSVSDAQGHAASTGRTVVTVADLESMLAAQADGLVDHAPIKLGHVSPLNDGIDLGDGAPAYGWVQPTRVGPRALDGAPTLFGDLVGMPDLLADVAPTMYRRRSVEIAWGVKTPGGKAYPAVVVGVALLGASPPAVKGLADLAGGVSTYSSAPADEGTRSDVLLVAGLEDRPTAVAMLAAARDAGAPLPVLDAIAAAAGARDTVDVPPVVADAVNDETTTTAASTPAPVPERTTMTVTDAQLRKLLKLEEGADLDAAVAELLKDHPAEGAPAATAEVVPPVTGGAPAPTPATPGVDTVPAAPAETGGELVGAGAGVATLSAATLAELQTDAAWARHQRRAGVLETAIREGRLAPAERGKFTSELSAGETQATGFAAALERDEAGTTVLINTLSPRFAVSELGADHATETTTDTAAEAAWDAFKSETFG